MVAKTVANVLPFTYFFALWVIYFALCFKTLKVEIKSIDDEYPSVYLFFSYLL